MKMATSHVPTRSSPRCGGLISFDLHFVRMQSKQPQPAGRPSAIARTDICHLNLTKPPPDSNAILSSSLLRRIWNMICLAEDGLAPR